MKLPITLGAALYWMEKSYEDHNIKVAEVECLVDNHDMYQVVIPRGTEFSGFFDEGGWRDVIRDLRTIPWRSKTIGGWSHAGFYKGARGIVEKGLFGLLRKDVPTLFMGHSLGGALALNAAALLHKQGFNVAGVLTFGVPRTFTKGTAKKIKKMFPVWEFSNPGDPVPDVPFRFWRYRHINEIYTDRERDGYSISNNHMMEHYAEWVGGQDTWFKG